MAINWPIEVDNHSVDGYVLEDADCNRLGRDELREVARRANAYDQLVAALEWYVEHDDTNDDDMFNDFWIAGRDKARAALAAAKGGGA